MDKDREQSHNTDSDLLDAMELSFLVMMVYWFKILMRIPSDVAVEIYAVVVGMTLVGCSRCKYSHTLAKAGLFSSILWLVVNYIYFYNVSILYASIIMIVELAGIWGVLSVYKALRR
ncbi:hypothetical protein [Oceanithermus desulfurans]|uniref:Uncharacterized protein n=2 Tax=Oceanithermus desulfurans TaxID=227924 RepID=A0A511RPS2_9DEIN|nr:hypothetical protein [Oceanithermus desulfurans]MBB6029950.1 hypothetical protein [Oceanithermus desulfurans]GEM90932.1 hypothetical protein ODE01S_23660 [Oceanithermus desulfurans NBRC 100063]